MKKLSTIGQRFERSRVGELAISVLVLAVLAIGVVWSMPDAPIKRVLTPGLQPVATATGLEQDWRMYAPEPLQRVEYVEVRVTMADGAQRVWTNPHGDRVIGAFGWYRWQKLKENIVVEPDIRAGLAHWVVRQLTRPKERAARVQMTSACRVTYRPPAQRPAHDGQRDPLRRDSCPARDDRTTDTVQGVGRWTRCRLSDVLVSATTGLHSRLGQDGVRCVGGRLDASRCFPIFTSCSVRMASSHSSCRAAISGVFSRFGPVTVL